MSLDFKGRHASVEGLDRIDAILKKMPRRARERALSQSLSAAGRLIRTSIRSRAPVRQEGGAKIIKAGERARLPGFLRQSIGVRRVRGQGSSARVLIGATGEAFYASFLEFGTKDITARPFIGPGFDAVAETAINRVRDELLKRTEREILKLAGEIPVRRRR